MNKIATAITLALLMVLSGCFGGGEGGEKPPADIPGCTNAGALNFNPDANIDDGSCEYPEPQIEGCTNSTATNYNPDANVDDGSCEYPEPQIEGCTNSTATNYNPDANVDDGTCEYPEPQIEGCTNSTATNYNPDANVDDGTCEFDNGGDVGESADDEFIVDASNITGVIAHVNGLMKGPTFKTE